MADRVLQLALVGCGGIAGAYLQALHGLAGTRLVAAVDTDPARRTLCGPDVAPFATVEELLVARAAGLTVDAALVLTPPVSHEALAVQLMAAGIHVLCEKPLAVSGEAARRMVAASRQHGRVLMMGSKFRYTPDMLRARQLLDEGAIGTLLLYENVFCSKVDMTRRWNSDPATAGGGVLVDNGSHSVDIARYLMGPIRRVAAQFGRKVQPIPVEDTARLLFESANGAVGSVDLSWSLTKEVPSYVRLYGDKGTLEVGWKSSRLKREGEREWTPFGSGYDKVGAFRAQLEDFAAVVTDRRTPRIGATDAIASVLVVEAAYRSARDHCWQDVDVDGTA